jgi:hypothetical protein
MIEVAGLGRGQRSGRLGRSDRQRLKSGPATGAWEGNACLPGLKGQAATGAGGWCRGQGSPAIPGASGEQTARPRAWPIADQGRETPPGPGRGRRDLPLGGRGAGPERGVFILATWPARPRPPGALGRAPVTARPSCLRGGSGRGRSGNGLGPRPQGLESLPILPLGRRGFRGSASPAAD